MKTVNKKAALTQDEPSAKPVITPPARNNEGLPNGWRWVKLGDLCLPKEGLRRGPFGSAIKKEFFVPTGYKVYEQGNAIYDDPDRGRYYIDEDKYNALINFNVKPGDLIVSCSGTLGRIAEIPSNAKPGIINQALLRIRLIDGIIAKKFFLYYFRSASFQKRIFDESQGTAMSNLIGIKDFKEIELLIPPLPVQHAIVSKIEELLSELDKGKQQLETAQQQLKIYRQAVLKWAFVNTNYKEFILKDVTDKIQIGPFGTQLHKEDYIEDGIPLINPMHIQDGIIQPDYSYSISREKLNSLPNYILKEGDVIMGRRGEMGRCGLVRKKESGWFCGTGSLYFRPQVKLLNSQFLYFYLSSEPVKKYLNENAGGTTMANLNLKIVNEIPISLPSVEKQELIVQEIESRLSVCDKVEEAITTSLAQAETLRQSILKKAFEGKLA